MRFHKRMPPVGSRPGTLAIPEGSPPPRIRVFDYGETRCEERSVEDAEELRAILASPDKTWVDVQGFGDEAKLRRIAAIFGLEPLTLEDATNVPQRAKSDSLPAHHLLIGRAPLLDADDEIELPQVCVIVGANFVLTLQDRYFGFFDAVRARLREGIGPIRALGPDYLAYALLDTLVDHYFPIVEKLASDLEDIEDRIDGDTSAALLADLHRIRRKLVAIRRIGWPQREALRSLAHDHTPFFTPQAQEYLRNTEQHITQIMEAVDSSREMATALVDIHLSNVSQRTNEVMKVLTLMASIFIPLTFIAGIYGMNFEYMPELHSRRAYPAVLTLMLGVAAGMLLYFRRKGWLGSRRGRS